MVHADGAGHLRDPLRGALRHGALCDARQGRRGRAGRVSSVARDPADVCANASPTRRQRSRGRRQLRGLLGVPRPAGRGQLNSSTRRSSRGSTPGTSRRQLLHYQTGVRGTAMGDQFGPQMAPMSQLVADAATRENVLAYIATLPNNPAPVTRDAAATSSAVARCTSRARRATAPKGKAVGAPTRRGSPA